MRIVNGLPGFEVDAVGETDRPSALGIAKAGSVHHACGVETIQIDAPNVGDGFESVAAGFAHPSARVETVPVGASLPSRRVETVRGIFTNRFKAPRIVRNDLANVSVEFELEGSPATPALSGFRNNTIGCDHPLMRSGTH